MSAAVNLDPVVARFGRMLRARYGERLERAVLYGSRARGDARPESDYDIAVFLRDMPDVWVEMDRLADIGTELLYEQGKVFHAMAFPAGSWQQQTPLMHEIRRDGVDL